MKTVIIYASQTGFTKQYAEWISEQVSCDCVELKDAKKLHLSDYDAIVYGGWFVAGGIKKVSWFKKQIPSLSAAGKKLIVFATGATPAESPDIPDTLRKNFTDDEWSKIKAFYCPGGLNYDRMNGLSKFVMHMLAKVLSSKKNASEDEKKKAELISRSYDISDKKYIDPIVAELA